MGEYYNYNDIVEEKQKKNNMIITIAAIFIVLIYCFIQYKNSGVTFLYSILGLVIALSVHEASHAFVAYKLGDNTSKNRISLNPLKHIDPIGLISLLLFGIGWGKPVYINPNNFNGTLKEKEKAESKVALAGPLSNIILAFIITLIMEILVRVDVFGNIPVLTMLFTIMTINLSLGVFNLIPIPPLDGYKIIRPILADGLKDFLDRYEGVIQMILIAVIALNIIKLDFIANITLGIAKGMAKLCNMIVGVFWR